MRESISGRLLPMVITLLALQPLPDRERDDRGDVPGWVMVTVMTATVIAALIPFVRTELQTLLSNAFSSVVGQ